MFKRVYIKVDPDFLKIVREHVVNAPREFERTYSNTVEALGEETIRKLSEEPGKPRYPIRWTSERQRKFVMAKLRRENNIPYKRTHAYSSAWMYQRRRTPSGGLFYVQNTALTDTGEPLEQYIQGDRQQGFHADTGWIRADTIIKEAAQEAELLLITAWEDVMGDI